MGKGAASSDGSKGTVTCCHVTHMHRSSEMFAVRYSVVLTDAICDSISGHARSFSKSVSVTAKVMTQAPSGGILRSCSRRDSLFCNSRLDGSQQYAACSPVGFINVTVLDIGRHNLHSLACKRRRHGDGGVLAGEILPGTWLHDCCDEPQQVVQGVLGGPWPQWVFHVCYSGQPAQRCTTVDPRATRSICGLSYVLGA